MAVFGFLSPAGFCLSVGCHGLLFYCGHGRSNGWGSVKGHGEMEAWGSEYLLLIAPPLYVVDLFQQ